MEKGGWRELADQGDFNGARAAWQEAFAGRETELEALWELAELEERWGDSRFFAGDSGSSPHYHAALRSALPQGALFTSRDENDLRMAAHGRVFQKLQSLDSSGKARADHTCAPHPNGGLTPERVAKMRREKAKQDAARERAAALKLALASRKEAAMQRRRDAGVSGTEFARLFQGAGHWSHYRLASAWREGGKSLANRYPEAAGIAFEWSLHYFGEYNREWTLGLPASRWDSDGGAEMGEVSEMRSALGTGSEPPPEWVSRLVNGEWTQSLARLELDPPAAELRPLIPLLAEACKAAGRTGDAEKLLSM